MSKQFYVLLDAMGIQAYIFATNKLKIIRNSSLALAVWQLQCLDLAAEKRGEIIVSAGGNVLAVFDGKEDADAFRRAAVVAVPPGMEIAWAQVERESGDDVATWQSLQLEIARYKAGERSAADYPEKDWPTTPPGCQFCGIRPVDNPGGKIEDKKICNSCRTLYNFKHKAKEGNPTALDRLENDIKRKYHSKNAFPIEATAIVSWPDDDVVSNTDDGGNDFLAAVVVDLNNMGETIKSKVKDGGFTELKKFSCKLEKEILDSVRIEIETLTERETSAEAVDRKFAAPLIPLVLAGDDLIFLLPGRLALKFARDLLHNLQKKGFPACAGVAFAKEKFPANRLVMMAETLCANAKKEVRYRRSKGELPGESSCALDWHLHQESSMIDPLAIRKKRSLLPLTQYKNKYAITTDRPYTLTEFDNILARIEPESSESGDCLWGLSQRKLFTLYQALRQGPEKTRQVLKYIFLRRENKDFSSYRKIWEMVEKIEGEYPLWEEHEEGRDFLYRTKICDFIEFYWLARGSRRQEVENG